MTGHVIFSDIENVRVTILKVNAAHADNANLMFLGFCLSVCKVKYTSKLGHVVSKPTGLHSHKKGH